MNSMLAEIHAALAGKRLPLEDEKATQAAIAGALIAADIDMEREVPVTGGIIDFVVTVREPAHAGMRFRHVGVEVKIKGQPAAIKRQVLRYCQDGCLDAVVLVTAKPLSMPRTELGKPISVIDISRAWL